MEGCALCLVHGTKNEDLPRLVTSAGDAVEPLPLSSGSILEANIPEDLPTRSQATAKLMSYVQMPTI